MQTFGIIGGGMIANFHAQAIQAMDGGQLGAIYARNPDKAAALGKKFNCKGYHQLNDLLDDPDIDIVTIATPSGAHLEPALASAQKGKHIICEKPLEVTPERIQQMIQACAENKVVLAGIFNRRFNPAVQRLKQAVEQGRFGRLTLCDAYVKWYRTQEYYDSGAWRGTWALDGGGALMNQSIHTIDQLIYLAGDIKRLSASVDCLIHEGIEVEDTAVAILEFESGARGVIEGATSCWSSTGHPAEVQLCGSEGSVFMADESFRVWDFKESKETDDYVKEHLMEGANGGLGANDPSAINFEGHRLNFEDVVQAIEAGQQPLVTGQEALKAVKVITAIYESARNNGKWVEL
ncbi:MAG TPA: Gfo/Idh/MocA family oxidoreductase [Saprospiraceae bacterium]|nr:Gfo/Idh/MocA family oxidoreductase [Saprospiraceae bacterium]